jgi:hypothetical protein
MKQKFLLLGFLLCGSFCAGAAIIEKNFTAGQVLDALGKPVGTIELRKKTLYLYPRGEVTIKAGVVSDFELMEKDEYLAEQEKQRIEREEWQADQERRAAMRRKEGKGIKTEKLRKETEQLRNRARYGLRTYTTPRTHQYPNYFRPPTVTIHSTGTNSQNSHNVDNNTRHNLGSSRFQHSSVTHAKGPSVKSPLGIRRNR